MAVKGKEGCVQWEEERVTRRGVELGEGVKERRCGYRDWTIGTRSGVIWAIG